MARQRKVRRFLVTIEEVKSDPLSVEHQEPPTMQTREPLPWWPTEQQKREQATAERLANLKARRERDANF